MCIGLFRMEAEAKKRIDSEKIKPFSPEMDELVECDKNMRKAIIDKINEITTNRDIAEEILLLSEIFAKDYSLIR